MAFKLNLVTMDIRKKIVESVKEDKIHDNEKTYISTQNFKKEEQSKNKGKRTKEKKRYLTIDGVKIDSKRMDIDAEIEEDALNEKTLGMFIDKKK